MIVHYHTMTGDELKRIYKVSGLKSEDFASKIGLEKHQLYTQFSRMAKPIDAEVETALKKVPELAQHQLILVKKQNSSPEQTNNSEGSEVVRLLSDTIQVLRDVLLKGEKTTQILSETNQHVRDEALTYRKMLMDGYEKGLLQWVKK